MRRPLSPPNRADRAEVAAWAGLCARCAHLQILRSRSTFVRCARSDNDSHFLRYPLLPVRQCPGWESAEED